MKLRSCFVSNSSSCSFTISKKAPEELLFFIYNHEEIIVLLAKLYRKTISINDVDDNFKPICQKFIANYNGDEAVKDDDDCVFGDVDCLFEDINPKNDYNCMIYDGWHIEENDQHISVSTGQDNLDLPRFLQILGHTVENDYDW